MNEFARERYARILGLPAAQIRFFGELDEAQIDEVRHQFSVKLIGVDKWVYAVRRDGTLVPNRERRSAIIERGG